MWPTKGLYSLSVPTWMLLAIVSSTLTSRNLKNSTGLPLYHSMTRMSWVRHNGNFNRIYSQRQCELCRPPMKYQFSTKYIQFTIELLCCWDVIQAFVGMTAVDLCWSVSKLHQALEIRKGLIRRVAVPQFNPWNLAKHLFTEFLSKCFDDSATTTTRKFCVGG